jgi:hypothetical protein
VGTCKISVMGPTPVTQGPTDLGTGNIRVKGCQLGDRQLSGKVPRGQETSRARGQPALGPATFRTTHVGDRRHTGQERRGHATPTLYRRRGQTIQLPQTPKSSNLTRGGQTSRFKSQPSRVGHAITAGTGGHRKIAEVIAGTVKSQGRQSNTNTIRQGTTLETISGARRGQVNQYPPNQPRGQAARGRQSNNQIPTPSSGGTPAGTDETWGKTFGDRQSRRSIRKH